MRRGRRERRNGSVRKNLETVDSFLARGGTVVRIKAPWEMTPEEKEERESQFVRDKNAWGGWGSYSDRSVRSKK